MGESCKKVRKRDKGPETKKAEEPKEEERKRGCGWLDFLFLIIGFIVALLLGQRVSRLTEVWQLVGGLNVASVT